MENKKITIKNLSSLLDKELGVSDWFKVTQKIIDDFAKSTRDFQFIHIDPKRAKNETLFGGTIAHGFLSLSLLSKFASEVIYEVENTKMSINYGFDKVRFINPVKCGDEIRARFELLDIKERSKGQILIKYKVMIEIKNEVKPALIANWLIIQLYR